MEGLAFRTQPEPFIQRKRVKHMPTGVAPLRRWVPLINLDKGSAIPRCFVLKLAGELAPSHIRDGFSEGVVLDHILDRETLDADHLVLVNDASRELVLIIPTPISNLSVCFSYLEPCFRTILTAFFLLTEPSLSLSQFLLTLSEVPRIAHVFPIGSDDHALQAKVKPHLLLHYRQVLDILFYQDGHEIASCGVRRDGHGGRLTACRQWPAPHNVQGSIHLGKGQLFPVPLLPLSGIFGGLLPTPTVELWVFCPPFKEITEGFIQVP